MNQGTDAATGVVNTADIVVETRGLVRTFVTGKVEVHALRGVDLVIRRGEFVAIAGPSGSGKTTLFNLIGGLDLPTNGQVLVAGHSIEGMSRRELSALRLGNIGFVFQAYNLIPVLSAYENIEYPLILRKVPVAERRDRVNRLLASVGLETMKSRRPAELSGGQQQRVAVARALVTEPMVVLADEPTANLDSETGEALIEQMRGLNADHGTTFLFSTHDPMVMERSRRLIRLKDGLMESDRMVSAGDLTTNS
jgi:putative ABC transport system ATP-binding protein